MRAKYKKKNSRKGKMIKNSRTPINPKKYSYKEFDNEKIIPAARKSPPLTFPNGPSPTLFGFIGKLLCNLLT